MTEMFDVAGYSSMSFFMNCNQSGFNPADFKSVPIKAIHQGGIYRYVLLSMLTIVYASKFNASGTSRHHDEFSPSLAGHLGWCDTRFFTHLAHRKI